MRRPFCVFMLVLLVLFLLSSPATPKGVTDTLTEKERNTISLDLEFIKKSPNTLQRVISFLNWGPNGYATGFSVGGRLVVTAYHVVSGNLDESKKLALGFGRDDQLEVKVYTNGCQAKVLTVDLEADLALLEVCTAAKESPSPLSEAAPKKDEKLLLIARPHGERIVSRGTFYGSYSLRGIDYWSARITARDGFSGSPVYDEQGRIVGVFSGYDWSKKLAIVSPSVRAQKLIELATAGTKP